MWAQNLTNKKEILHENSASPHGTFDQSGNVWEWNEAILYGWDRGARGGSDNGYDGRLRSASFCDGYPADEGSSVGFRVFEVPEPGTLALLLGGMV
jgi:formylglycine-generating enzyme required for sulfatase activity